MRGTLAIAYMALATQCAGQDGRQILVKDCNGLGQVPAPMTEDIDLFVDVGDGTDSMMLFCDRPTTVVISGPYGFHMSSNAVDLRLTNLRFVIKDKAKFSLGSREVGCGGETVGSASFGSTLEIQQSGERIFEVMEGSEATFAVPVLFEGNSLVEGRSGAAIAVDGLVTFKHVARFVGNEARSSSIREGDSKDVQDDAACGGGLHVGKTGRVIFSEFASFEANSVRNGGQGGAVCNYGSLTFMRRSFFTGNVAYGRDSGAAGGGQGGALFTGEGGRTTFVRKAIMHQNMAGTSGGALHNEGDTTFETSAFFGTNEATGALLSVAGGGHIFNRGKVSVLGDVSFREGATEGDGGAVLTPSGGETVLKGIVSFDGNSAEGQCDDMYAAGAIFSADNPQTSPHSKIRTLRGGTRPNTTTNTARIRRKAVSSSPQGCDRDATCSPCLP